MPPRAANVHDLPGLAGREARVQVSFRVDAHTRDAFTAAAEAHGFEFSGAARCMFELAVQRIDAGENLFDVLKAFQAAKLPASAGADVKDDEVERDG